MADVIIALDLPGRTAALEMVDRLGGEAGFYKVGLELFTSEGPGVVSDLKERGKRVFLDLKLHDIPNTVGGAVRSAAALGVDLLTVHAMGGRAMIEAAVEAGREAGEALGTPSPRILAVTILTSLDAKALGAVSGREIYDTRAEVLRLGGLAVTAGAHGLVASAREAQALRSSLGDRVLLVTPGIRLKGGDTHDQTRVTDPGSAVRAGSDYLVVGRTVTAAPDPAAALEQVRQAMEAE
jgi:orotidine-5'-phosphate decarboxylase